MTREFSRATIRGGAVSLLIAAALLLVAGFFFVLWMGTSLDFGGDESAGDSPFSQAAWLMTGSERDGTRMAMRRAAATVAEGLDETSVGELLGDPDRVESDPRRWWYLLGPEPGPFGIDSLWLVLDFSGDGLARPTELTD